MFSGMTTYSMTLLKGMSGKATRGRKRRESFHDMMEGRDYEQFKQIEIETGQQVRMHVRNLLETAED